VLRLLGRSDARTLGLLGLLGLLGRCSRSLRDDACVAVTLAGEGMLPGPSHRLAAIPRRPSPARPASVERMDLALLADTLAGRSQPAYRARQIWDWAARGAAGYEAMTNVPAALRADLAADVPFSTLELERQAEARDGTVKALFCTWDGKPVEAVLMRYRDGRRSICVSSQSGCPLTCTFCATGQMRFGRNLTASEILDQALHFRRIEAVDHCVFMGMGEPMLNLDAVLEAARRLPDLGITNRRTTISTVGWLPGLRRFVDEVEEPIRLALSLHAADPALRSRLMPVNERFPIADVVAECRRYVSLRRRRVFVEYVMLAGVNDSPDQAAQLAALLDPKAFKVNLIPYNPTGAFDGSSRPAIAAFKAVLDRSGVPATVRLTRGRDIDAACGQLAAQATAQP
jgi:23S rRNA (adenine2503-C2)-methyltransferase